jgi:hypothetical protein
MRRALALLLISAAAVLVAPTVANAGGGTPADMDVDLVSPVEPLTFSARFTENDTCVAGEFEAAVTANGTEVTPISATQSNSDPDEFLFVLPNATPPGELEIQLTCDAGEGTAFGSDTQNWAALGVTKVVSGPGPLDAAYTVHVDCVNAEADLRAADIAPDFDVDLHYVFAGGLHYVYTDHDVDCTITEPVNGGASSVTIVPPNVSLTVDEEQAFTATVTNTFPAAAVVTQPSFTG